MTLFVLSPNQHVQRRNNSLWIIWSNAASTSICCDRLERGRIRLHAEWRISVWIFFNFFFRASSFDLVIMCVCIRFQPWQMGALQVPAQGRILDLFLGWSVAIFYLYLTLINKRKRIRITSFKEGNVTRGHAGVARVIRYIFCTCPDWALRKPGAAHLTFMLKGVVVVFSSLLSTF